MQNKTSEDMKGIESSKKDDIQGKVDKVEPRAKRRGIQKGRLTNSHAGTDERRGKAERRGKNNGQKHQNGGHQESDIRLTLHTNEVFPATTVIRGKITGA
jgi:hypothetical protein